jgi:hypothetical protein
MFPTTISESPLNEATELTTSYGAEVSKAPQLIFENNLQIIHTLFIYVKK